MRFNEKTQVAIEKCVWATREMHIPRRPYTVLRHPEAKVTGNLKFNATKVRHGANSSRVFVDERIAPYMPYTNEPWISSRWHGAKNPNENWFAEYTEEFAKMLAIELGGELVIKEK